MACVVSSWGTCNSATRSNLMGSLGSTHTHTHTRSRTRTHARSHQWARGTFAYNNHCVGWIIFELRFNFWRYCYSILSVNLFTIRAFTL
jgi:hypothetical protein